MSIQVDQLSACRACGGSRLERFLRLPEMPLTDDFVAPARFGQEFRHDLEVFVCADCFTAQTQHDVDVGDYYADYQYSVGSSPTATRFMRLVAANLLSRFFPGRSGVRVLEVGSGDGAQLLAFRELGCEVLGYEPSSKLKVAAEQRGIPTVLGLFGADSVGRLPAGFKKVDAIVLSYTFDHLPRPRAFLDTAAGLLEPDTGVLVVEVHDLEKIFARQEFCLFEHEHSIYLTAQTAAQLVARSGLTILDWDLVPQADRRGNSLMFVAALATSRLARQFGAAPTNVPSDFRTLPFYKTQGELIRRGIANLDAFADRVVAAGRTLAGYGGGGRGVMTLAAMASASKFRYLVDKKPKGNGLLAPKSGVPLAGLDRLQELPVDEILVFSFGYLPEIVAEVGRMGYRRHQFHSLLDVLAGTTRERRD